MAQGGTWATDIHHGPERGSCEIDA